MGRLGSDISSACAEQGQIIFEKDLIDFKNIVSAIDDEELYMTSNFWLWDSAYPARSRRSSVSSKVSSSATARARIVRLPGI